MPVEILFELAHERERVGIGGEGRGADGNSKTKALSTGSADAE